METSQNKDVFGILVALAALFVLWLWSSGNYGKLAAALTGTTGSGPASPPAGAGSSPASSPAGAASAPLVTTNPTPNYAATLPNALPLPDPQSIGGATHNGATSGGVSITPTVFSVYSDPSNPYAINGDASVSAHYGASPGLLALLGLGPKAAPAPDIPIASAPQGPSATDYNPPLPQAVLP